MKLDALIVAAHPDDAEISMGGTILRLVDAGRKVGVLDLTRGEMGTRGTAEERDREAERATELMGIHWRGCLDLPDGRVRDDLASRELMARRLRELRPELVIAHHDEDLHPDHAACGRLTREAWYLAGLKRLAELDEDPHGARRPLRLMHFMGHVPFDPTLVVDITPVWKRKLDVVRCFASQLEDSEGDGGEHFLFGADILERVHTKARYYGERIGVAFGEPLLHRGPLPVSDPSLF